MECFYAGGLKFACMRCRYCCSSEPGFVFLTFNDIQRLCRYTHLEPKNFLHLYCRKVPQGSISYISLAEKENNDCVFLTDSGCSVYDARPLQCAAYPFWPSILADRWSWMEEQRYCPGIGQGRLYEQSEIERLLACHEQHAYSTWDEICGTKPSR